MTRPDSGRLALFFGVLVGLAVVLICISWISGTSMIALGPAYMFTPLIAGVVVCIVRGISLSSVGLRVGQPKWLAGSLVVALPLIGLTLLLSVAVPGIAIDPSADPVPGLALPPGVLGLLAIFGLVLAVGATVNALFALGEEFGWRGYLLWELAPIGFWKASLVIGAVWGLWHAPIIVEGYNYPTFPFVGIASMMIACIAFSPLYTYLVIRSNSVLSAAFLHGAYNGSAGLVLVYTTTESSVLEELVASPVGVAGIAAFGLVAAVIAIRGAPTLDRETVTTDGVGTDGTVAGGD